MSAETLMPIASRQDFLEAIRTAIDQAADIEAGEIFFVDPHFMDWPLNERRVIESLARWASSRHKLVVFARSFDDMARRQVRFAEWRRQWSHIVSCRSDDELEADQVPTLLCIPGLVCIRLADRVRYRGVVSGQPSDQVQCRESIDALLQRSFEAYPVTTLGL